MSLVLLPQKCQASRLVRGCQELKELRPLIRLKIAGVWACNFSRFWKSNAKIICKLLLDLYIFTELTRVAMHLHHITLSAAVGFLWSPSWSASTPSKLPPCLSVCSKQAPSPEPQCHRFSLGTWHPSPCVSLQFPRLPIPYSFFPYVGSYLGPRWCQNK